MPYRGLLYFVSQSASSDYRSDPYATERRSLPNRTHGIRYASAPKRSTCIRTYAPSETVRPVCASSTTAASQASRSVEPQRMLKAVFAMVLVAVLSAFLGIFAAHVLSAAIDDGAFPPHRIGRRRHRRRRLQHPSIVMGTRRRAHPVSG